MPEAEVAGQIKADLHAQNLTLGELGIDRAYLSLSLVRDRPDDLVVFCRAFPVRNGPRFAKPAFHLDFDQGLLTCPTTAPWRLCRAARSSTPGPCRPLAGPACPLPGPAQEPVRLRRVAAVHNLHVIARQPRPARHAA